MIFYLVIDEANNIIGLFNTKARAIQIAREHKSPWHRYVRPIEISKEYTDNPKFIYATEGDDIPW